MEYICGECFNDKGMKDFCSVHAVSEECDFCGATADEPIAAPIDDVTAHINSCVHEHFDDPANAGLPYESAEGGYQGTTYDSDEVLMELELDFPNDRDGHLREAVLNGLDNVLWSEAEPFALSPSQQLHYSWERFCRVIKHERRYFFFQEEERHPDDDRDELFSPGDILRSLFRYARDVGAFVTLPVGSQFYRARPQPDGESYTTARDLGPLPRESAVQSNRMSPPGVVMTYVAENRETALAETASDPGNFAVGQFTNDRDLLILDLANLPEIPTAFAEIWDSMEFDPRQPLNFLAAISFEISRPIARDNRVHVEYVPTQVVTEYVRTAIRIDGRKVDGIRYSSSRHDTATAMVLFADQNNVIYEGDERPEYYRTDDRWLRLETATPARVTSRDIERWADNRQGFLHLVA